MSIPDHPETAFPGLSPGANANEASPRTGEVVIGWAGDVAILPRMQGYGLEPRVENGPALSGYGAEAMRESITSKITTLPAQLRRSLTWDRGKELAQHAQLKIDTDVAIYFADPHSPWQRGTNETL